MPTEALLPRQMEVRVEHTLDYLLYLPEGYENRDDWPMVVSLHGGGESGTDLTKVKQHGLPKLVANGHAFDFVMIAPQNPYIDRMWDDAAVMTLIDQVLPQLGVDQDRVIVTGLSRGGMATWRIGMQHPDRFAGLVPIAAGALPVYAFRLKEVPVWAFYGAADNAVLLNDARRVADRLEDEGGDITTTIYPDADHASAWERAYAEPSLYRWIEERRR